MATAQQAEVACPKCGGAVWDNRLTKKNFKAPDFKCRNRACDGVIWPPRQTTNPRPQIAPPAEFGDLPGVPVSQAPVAAPAAPQANGQERLQRIFKVQELCFTHALTMAAKAEAAGVAPTLEGVSALTAQALIQFFGDKR